MPFELVEDRNISHVNSSELTTDTTLSPPLPSLPPVRADRNLSLPVQTCPTLCYYNTFPTFSYPRTRPTPIARTGSSISLISFPPHVSPRSLPLHVSHVSVGPVPLPVNEGLIPLPVSPDLSHSLLVKDLVLSPINQKVLYQGCPVEQDLFHSLLPQTCPHSPLACLTPCQIWSRPTPRQHWLARTGASLIA